LHEHPIPVAASDALATNLPAMMARLLADTVATGLVPGMRLDTVSTKRRLNELEFLFPAESLDFPSLRRVLVAHGFPDVALEAGTLRGFVKGFIDLIVEHEGRFWIVDWKSNHLGLTPADYNEEALDAAMASHAYHLQALFYTVALHRYLRLRLRDYAFERHIGGYLYLFVRGVRPGWRDGDRPAGVHVGNPSLELIEAIDRLMQGVAA
jgi:exodeoxyribonuclease V beta subunit